MNAHAPRLPSRAPRTRSFERLLGARAPLAAGLALAGLLAIAPGAAASTADALAQGQQVDLTLTGVFGGTTRILSAPQPMVEVAAPPADALQGSADLSRVDGPAGLGTLLSTGRITVDAAASAEPDPDDASAAVLLRDVRLALAGLLTLNADTIAAGAQMLPEDGESCWSGTLGGGSANFQRATLGGSLVPAPIALPPGAPPDFVLFDRPGVATVTLNEQAVDGGRVTVDAVHVELHALTMPGIGTLRGDIRLGRAEAVVACGGADVEVALATSGEPGGAGDPLVYTATVSNLGPERAMDTLVSLPLPLALDPLSAIPSQGSCTITGGLVTCSLGDLKVGREAAIEVVMAPGHSGGVPIPADVAAANFDPAPRHNHACEPELVAGTAAQDAHLSVEVGGSADPVFVGQQLTYELRVIHGGGDAVPGALASLDLPFGTLLLSVTPAQGSCTGERTIVCDLGPMAAGQEATVTVDVLVLVTGELEAAGFVSSELTDPELADNFRVRVIESKEPGA